MTRMYASSRLRGRAARRLLLGALAIQALALWCVGAVLSQPRAAAPVVLATIDGPILPPTRSYVARALQQAGQEGAACLLVRMDTPGGRSDTMREIAEDFLASRVPVVVWVGPAGARAGSAGAVISLAAGLVAMAPGANIGAAHPVTGSGGDIPGDMREKVTNDAAAFARSLAQHRGRDPKQAEAIVRKSISLTAQEAVNAHIADLVAPSERDLLRALDGRTVPTVAGPKTLHTANAPVHEERQTWLEVLLTILFDPNVALILGTVAFYGLVAEINHPGAIVPGVAGSIALILSLYSFSVLSVNTAGAALVMLGLALFIVDVYATSHGVLTIGGLMAFVGGAMMLFNGSPTGVRVSLAVIVPLALLTAGFFGFVLSAAWRSRHRRASSGAESLIGAEAEARTALAPEGQVFVDGAIWAAVNVGPDPVQKGETVIVEGRQGLKLSVRRAAAPEPEPIWSAAQRTE